MTEVTCILKINMTAEENVLDFFGKYTEVKAEPELGAKAESEAELQSESQPQQGEEARAADESKTATEANEAELTPQLFIKESCFVRYIGVNETTEEYIKEIQAIENEFMRSGNSIPYHRTDGFRVISSPEEVTMLIGLHEQWKEFKDKSDEELLKLDLPVIFSHKLMNTTAKLALKEVLALYNIVNPNVTESIAKNFTVKFLGWILSYVPMLYPAWNFNESPNGASSLSGCPLFPKLVFAGDIKQHEYLFLYFLFMIGCDVLYLNPKAEPIVLSNPLKSVSRQVLCKHMATDIDNLSELIEKKESIQVNVQNATHVVTIPPRQTPRNPQGSPISGQQPSISQPQNPQPPVKPATAPAQGAAQPSVTPINMPTASGNTSPIRMEVGRHPGRSNKPREAQGNLSIVRPNDMREEESGGKELSYEELARYAGSVVMMKVYDENDECFKTGSGVIVSSKGYLLTNYHVIAGGTSFGIQFENDPQEHRTQDIIKCHSFNDLAVLKVPKSVTPIRLYEGEAIIRGKQVVAIGSPLGLFNSVSNGIVSGFRNIGDVSMIQFTAPTSHGSSGGALLDLRGRLIGIITAGFDDGQNLNLAVDYITIKPFINGFL